MAVKFPLVGAAYKFDALSIDCQTCINWYPQAIEVPNGSRVAALIPTAGLELLHEESGAVRCLHVLSNGALLAVINRTLYHSASSALSLQAVDGTIGGSSIVDVSDNGRVAMIVNGSAVYSFDMTTLVLTKLTGSSYPRSNSVAFLDGRFVLHRNGTGRFVWTDLYSTNIDGLSFATAEADPDPIVRIVQFARELWIFGTRTTERYYSTGDANSPYARIPAGYLEVGCIAPFSACAFGQAMIWLTQSSYGGGQVVISNGGGIQRVSTHAIESELSRYSKITDAVAYTYQDQGHSFYVLSFPSANKTWVYDIATQMWHQRSWTDESGNHNRHRAQCHAF